jgi:hypothetical protein
MQTFQVAYNTDQGPVQSSGSGSIAYTRGFYDMLAYLAARLCTPITPCHTRLNIFAAGDDVVMVQTNS